jgi:hypothetical protein
MTASTFGRLGLALLGLAAAVGCSSTEPGASLAIVPASASIVQGGSASLIAVVSRNGGFTGTVNLTVTGAPTGVTGVVSNVQTAGAVTTATITISADNPSFPAAPGTYSLVVHATGIGATEATAAFALTVTQAAFRFENCGCGVGIEQGRSGGTTVTLVRRVNFTDPVTLSVTGLPAGVTAAFAPNPVTGDSSQLTLTVGAAAVPGDYNLTVNGTATAGNQHTEFGLRVVPVGGFTLTTTPPTTASLTQGSNSNVTVNLNRTGGNTSDVALTATGTLPTGLTLSFLPASTTTNTSMLTITTTAATPVGTYPIVIHGSAFGLNEQLVTLNITVVAP